MKRRSGLPFQHTSSFRSSLGFTLIEVIIAIAILAVMALMSWRGISGIGSAKDASQKTATEVSVIQMGLLQWDIDLNHMVATTNIPALNWTGSVLRLTRLDTTDPSAGLVIVAWGVFDYRGQSYWMRWQSPAVKGYSEWKRAWESAANWGKSGANAAKTATPVLPVLGWTLARYSQGDWLNFKNNSTYQPRRNRLPYGLKLTLNLPTGQVLSGSLEKIWVSPAFSSEAEQLNRLTGPGGNNPPNGGGS